MPKLLLGTRYNRGLWFLSSFIYIQVIFYAVSELIKPRFGHWIIRLMQTIRVHMNEAKLNDCLYMFNSCDQHPRTLEKIPKTCFLNNSAYKSNRNKEDAGWSSLWEIEPSPLQVENRKNKSRSLAKNCVGNKSGAEALLYGGAIRLEKRWGGWGNFRNK